MAEPIFTVEYKGESYTYKYGSRAFIFHCAVMNGIDEKYGMDDFHDYMGVVSYCYQLDDTRCSLGHLADFIAENWIKAKHMFPRQILDEFYKECI